MPAGMLRVGSALPDPRFELEGDDGVTGFDPAVMRAVAARLGREFVLVRSAEAREGAPVLGDRRARRHDVVVAAVEPAEDAVEVVGLVTRLGREWLGTDAPDSATSVVT